MDGLFLLQVRGDGGGFWVSVGWPQGLAKEGELPSRLSGLVTWFLSVRSQPATFSVSDVLAALDRLECRSLPSTVLLSHAVAPASATAIMQTEPGARTPYGHTRVLTPREVQDINPHVGDRQSDGTYEPGFAAAAKEPYGSTPSVRARVAAFVSIIAGALVVLALVLWTMAGRPAAPDPAPARTAVATPALPSTPPRATGSGAEQSIAAPIAVKPDSRAQEAAEADNVVVTSVPAGADLCDAHNGQSLGHTPVTVNAGSLLPGHDLVLIASGYRAAKIRWPPRKKVILKPLGVDEAEPMSPCAF